jgi:hypothetical protein
MDGQDIQDFPADGGLAVLDIRKSARDHRRSRPLTQQPPVLIILCILCIHVQLVDNRINRTGSLLPIGHEEKRKEIHSYSCLFVFIRGSSLLTTPCFTLE